MRISDWSSDVCSSDLAEENVAECGIALVGKAFRQLKTTVFVDRNAALQVLREPARIAEGNLGARPGLNRGGLGKFVVPVNEHVQKQLDDHARRDIGRASSRERGSR